MRKFALYTSVAVTLAVGFSQPAWSQTEQASSTSDPQGQVSADAAQEPSAGIEDIIVTAQRFEDTAQKTPLVITTITGDDLAGVSNVRQLQAVTPGVQISPAGNNVQTYVRGVGTFAATTNQESAIAYNVDGVFLYTSMMATPLIYDLERVEVLKGPQGTLYGRNASGGAINLITTGARLGRTEGYVEGELGNYDLRRIVGAVNLPLGETAAIRFSGQHVEHDGYLSDGTDDQKLTSGRVRFKWEASPDVTLQLRGDISHSGGNGAGTTITPNPLDEKFVGGLDPRFQTGVPFPPVFGTSLLSFPPNPRPFFDDDQWSVSAQLDANLGFATLTVLPAYRYENVDMRTYAPGYEVRELQKGHQKSLEVRLANRSDALKWVLGGYYFKMDQDIEQIVREELTFLHIDDLFKNEVESYAFFGEATFSVSDQFRVIGGLRYTHEKGRIFGTNNSIIGPPGIINPFTGLPNVQTVAFNPFGFPGNVTGELLDFSFDNPQKASAVTWKVGAEYDLAPDSLLFATVSRGFKGGGAFVDTGGANSTFKPEYLTAFQLGSRNRFLDNTLQLNFEAFYWKLKDQQIPYLGLNSFQQVTFITANAGRAHMYGGSVDAVYKLTRDDTFHFGVEYVKSKYDSFVRTVPSFGILPNTICHLTGYNPTPGSAAPTTFDCSGLPLLRAPKWSGSASYEHRFDLGNDSEIRFDGDMTFQSSSYIDSNYTPIMKQDSVALFNARLTYQSPGDRFEVTAWIRNIANEEVFVGGAQNQIFYGRVGVMPPRTFGVSGRVNF